jgi:oligoribonuclease NrnB/cAMP/cGMP phosphodiesterase (DHH superfamily)
LWFRIYNNGIGYQITESNTWVSTKKRLNMKKYYKITNTNTRTVFQSMDEVNAYINKKKPKIKQDGEETTQYEVTETIERIHKIPNVNTLSESTKLRLIDKIKVLLNDGYKLRVEMPSLLMDIFKTEDVGVISDEVKEYVESYKPNYTKTQGETKIVKRYILDNIDNWMDQKFLRVSTDYKPCNYVGMEVKLTPKRSYYLMLREGDIVFSNFDYYGRHVHIRGKYELSDDDKF